MKAQIIQQKFSYTFQYKEKCCKRCSFNAFHAIHFVICVFSFTILKIVSGQHSFIKKVAWLFSGLFVVQIINLLFAMLLPRIYSPEQFAVFGIFLSTVLIFFEINNFRLDQALMLPKDEDESIFIYQKAVGYSSLFSLGLAILWLLYRLSPFFNEIYASLGWTPLSIFLQGVIQPTISYSNRIQSYKLINVSRISQAFITGSVSCLPLLTGSDKIYLIEGFIAGQLASIIILISLIYKNLKSFDKSRSFSIQTYIKFPKYGTWSSLLNTISRNAIVYILNIFFTPQLVGLYTFTNRLVQAPIGLITSSIGQAYFRDASHAASHQELKQLTNHIQKILTQIALVPVVIALFFGPHIFAFLFGEEWRPAGEIARYLSLWYGTTLVITPLSMLVDVKGRLKWELGYNICFAVARISLLLLGGFYLNFRWTMILFCAISVIFNLYLLIFVRQIVNDEN